MTEAEMIRRVNTIYMEEYGKELSAKIDIFHSSESNRLKNDKFGYDGTAIHIYSEDNNINEVYVISQGSQGSKDWFYNIKAMFAGMDFKQAEMTNEFVKDVKEQFNIRLKDSVPIIGLSHSLAHNNNTTAYLAYDTFTEIYSVNGAQTNYYQLVRADPDFQEEIMNHFSISLGDFKITYRCYYQRKFNSIFSYSLLVFFT